MQIIISSKKNNFQTRKYIANCKLEIIAQYGKAEYLKMNLSLKAHLNFGVLN